MLAPAQKVWPNSITLDRACTNKNNKNNMALRNGKLKNRIQLNSINCRSCMRCLQYMQGWLGALPITESMYPSNLLPNNNNRLEWHSYRSAVFKRDGDNALEYLLDIRLIFPLGLLTHHLLIFIKPLCHGHREQPIGVWGISLLLLIRECKS